MASPRPARPRSAPPSMADKHPGAGFEQLELAFCPPSPAPSSPSTPLANYDGYPFSPVASTSRLSPYSTATEDWEAICEQKTQAIVEEVLSPDSLLDRGIADYTVTPGGRLGRGKFSVVYRAEKGGKEYAIKHTPLHPHHPLIASRLIREPQLLAQLPPHPNLIKIYETVRTAGHFYLVEEFLPSHVSLDTLCMAYPSHRLPISLVQHILNQLVSVARDAMHSSSVCHRDIKPENVMVNPEDGHITLIDLGLSTHYSLSAPKLTTCCGSPAFHCPEIVKSLSLPPGVVTYWGPEVDVWCVALTVLRCWTGKRYPLGTSHTNLAVMKGRVEDALASVEVGRGRENGRELRETLRSFLDMDGNKRMEAFRLYDVGAEVRRDVQTHGEGRDFKQTTFGLTTPKYTLPIYPMPPASDSRASSPARPIPKSPSPARSIMQERLALEKEPPASSTIILRNPEDQHRVKVVSFLKFALRSANILYHTRSIDSHSHLSSNHAHFNPLHTFSTPSSPMQSTSNVSTPYSSQPSTPTSSLPKTSFLPRSPFSHPSEPPQPPMDILQCVLVLPALPPPPKPVVPLEPTGGGGFLTSLFRSSAGARSASTPAAPREPPPDDGLGRTKRSQSGSRKDVGKERKRCLVFFIALRFSPPQPGSARGEMGIDERRRRSQSRRGQRSRGGPGGPGGRTESLARERRSSRGSDIGGPSTSTTASQRFASPGRGVRTESDTSSSSNKSNNAEASSSGTHTNSTSSADSTPATTPSPLTALPLPRVRRQPHPRSRNSSTTGLGAGLRSSSTYTERAPSSRQVSTQHISTDSHSAFLPHAPQHPYDTSPSGPTEPYVEVYLSDPRAMAAIRAAFSIAPYPPPPLPNRPPPPANPVGENTKSRRAVPIPTSPHLSEEEEDQPRGRSSGRMSDHTGSYSSAHSQNSSGTKAPIHHHVARMTSTTTNRDRDLTPKPTTPAKKTTVAEERSPPTDEEDDEDDGDGEEEPTSPAPQGRPLFPFFEQVLGGGGGGKEGKGGVVGGGGGGGGGRPSLLGLRSSSVGGRMGLER